MPDLFGTPPIPTGQAGAADGSGRRQARTSLGQDFRAARHAGMSLGLRPRLRQPAPEARSDAQPAGEGVTSAGCGRRRYRPATGRSRMRMLLPTAFALAVAAVTALTLGSGGNTGARRSAPAPTEARDHPSSGVARERQPSPALNGPASTTARGRDGSRRPSGSRMPHRRMETGVGARPRPRAKHPAAGQRPVSPAPPSSTDVAPPQAPGPSGPTPPARRAPAQPAPVPPGSPPEFL